VDLPEIGVGFSSCELLFFTDGRWLRGLTPQRILLVAMVLRE
jgi:hypothetical protein